VFQALPRAIAVLRSFVTDDFDCDFGGKTVTRTGDVAIVAMANKLIPILVPAHEMGKRS
jgi:hypothetical protein